MASEEFALLAEPQQFVHKYDARGLKRPSGNKFESQQPSYLLRLLNLEKHNVK